MACGVSATIYLLKAGIYHMQDILETWRLRTPNEWEQLTVWSDVLTWRNAIYNVIINAFKHMGDLAPHLHQLGYKDKAWCVSSQTAPCRAFDILSLAVHWHL